MKWLEEIKTSKKREKHFFDEGKKILDVYEGKNTPFNILYSNTETLLPALFSALPRPVITRRFKDDDPLGKVISDASQRMLEYLLDTDLDEYDNFTETLTDVTLDGLLPGRGNCQIKYDADDDVNYETICTDTHPWDRVHYGYARKWSKVPWVAYEFNLPQDEAKEMEIDDKDIVYSEGKNENNNDEEGQLKTACFYQIWYKEKKQVLWICDQTKNRILKTIEDPLKLSGFYNCPKPLQFVKRPSDLVPIALYKLYENQAKELNKIQLRINKIVESIKARAIYDKSLGEELENMFKEADGSLVPASEGSMLADGSIERAVWFWPVEKLIIVLQQLYQARESCKSVIYEITGISDILRGQSRASETLGAQQIKESWGTMRLKRLQGEVQRYALDMIKIMLEIAANKFSEKTWQKITMLSYPTTSEKKRAQELLRDSQANYQKRVQIAQDSGLQPEPFKPDPRLQEIIGKPSWGDILKILKDDFQRSYRIDIETNSTLDVEATEDKQNVAEFMNAFGQTMAGLSNSDLPFEAKKQIILAVTKRYRFGREVEDAINTMQQTQLPPEIQNQIQQAQQQIQQQTQSIQQEKQKLTEERNQLELDKEKFKLEIEFENKLDKLEETQVKADLRVMFDDQERKLQSMTDKVVSRIK